MAVPARPGYQTWSVRPSASYVASVRLPVSSVIATSSPQAGSSSIVVFWPFGLVDSIFVTGPAPDGV